MEITTQTFPDPVRLQWVSPFHSVRLGLRYWRGFAQSLGLKVSKEASKRDCTSFKIRMGDLVIHGLVIGVGQWGMAQLAYEFSEGALSRTIHRNRTVNPLPDITPNLGLSKAMYMLIHLELSIWQHLYKENQDDECFGCFCRASCHLAEGATTALSLSRAGEARKLVSARALLEKKCN